MPQATDNINRKALQTLPQNKKINKKFMEKNSNDNKLSDSEKHLR